MDEQTTIMGRPSELAGSLRALADILGGPGPLARRLGASVRSLQRWNQGAGAPSGGTRVLLQQLCEEHGIKLEPHLRPSTAKINPVEAGRQIREARERAELSQTELARRMKTTQPYLSGVEHGNLATTEKFVRRALKVCASSRKN